MSFERWPSTRWLCAIAALLVFAYAILLASFSTAGLPTGRIFAGHMPFLADKPVGEDAYYMLTVADNIAARGAIQYNRGIEATGIQPLATFVFAGIAWVLHRVGGSEWDLIRGILLLGATLFLIFAYQVGSIARSLAPARSGSEAADLAFCLGFLLVVADYTLFRLFTYGLETGVYLVCLALCFACTERIVAARATSWRDAVLLGLAGGAAGLARIDFGLLFAILLGILLVRRYMNLMQVGVSGLIALVIVSPWFLFVHRVTGSFMPSSGKAESGLVTMATLGPRLKIMILAIASHLAPWSYAGVAKPAMVAGLVSVVLVGWLAYSSAGERSRREAPLGWRMAGLWLPGIAVLLVVYTVLFFSTWFYTRYAAPLAVVVLPLLAVVLAGMPWVRDHVRLAGGLLACTFVVWTVGALHTGRVGNTSSIDAGYVHTYYPDAHVGAFQSGVIGYFNRDVENLDGKLNLPAYQAWSRNQLPALLDKEGVDVLVDWPTVMAKYLPQSYLDAEWKPCPVPLTGTGSVCLVRKNNQVAGVRP